jgi:uncharacterized membrane protein
MNCLLVGYLVGGNIPIAAPRWSPSTSTPAPASTFNDRLKQLPNDERQKFQDVMAMNRLAIRQAREELLVARTRLTQAMAAEPYDANQLRQAFAEVRNKTVVLQERVQDATAQALAALTPDSRKRLAGP